MHILSRCSPNQNVRSNAWIQWLHWAEECCINLVSSPYHQYGVEIYLRLSPARSLDVRLTHPCIHFPFVLSLTKYNSTEACAIYRVQSPFNPALSGHGQIAPPLLMLLFLACRHNWNKVLPPSTSDGWECCLLSMLPFKQNHCGLFFIQIAIYYLRYYTRQFFPTTVVVWAALVAFALQQLNNNSLDQT